MKLKLLLVSCMLLTVMCKGKQRMPELVAHYSTNEGSGGFTLLLSVFSGGKVLLKSPENLGFEISNSVGVFETKVPASTVENLEAIVASAAFERIPLPEGVLPGEVVRTIQWERENVDSLRRSAHEYGETHPLFQDAEREFKMLIAQSALFPVQTLRTQCHLSTSQSLSSDTVMVELIFTNTGTADFSIPNFNDAATALELAGVRKDISLESLGSEHQFFHTITPTAILEISSEVQPNGRILLKSGHHCKVKISWVPALPMGIYEVKCSLETILYDENDSAILSVRCHSDVETLEVI